MIDSTLREGIRLSRFIPSNLLFTEVQNQYNAFKKAGMYFTSIKIVEQASLFEVVTTMACRVRCLCENNEIFSISVPAF
jgi:hypothetical protein